MSYRYVPKKAVRYTDATRPDLDAVQESSASIDSLTYRELQARAVELGINGKQSKEALVTAIQEAEQA